jgi:hypothetical protein
MPLAQGAQQREAVRVGEPEVEQREREVRVGRCQRQRLRRARGFEQPRLITSGDWSQMKASVGRLVSQSACGAAPANQLCGKFDHDGSGAVVTDFNAAKAALGKVIALAHPKCAACNAPFSAAPGGAVAPVLGRAVCAGPACAY